MFLTNLRPTITALAIYFSFVQSANASPKVPANDFRGLPAHFHKDVRSEDYKDPFSIDLIVAVVGGKPCVQFEGYSPATTHQSSFTTTAKFIDANTLSFNFTDDWGTKGKGTITLSRQNALARFTKTASSPGGVDAAESWPQNEIIPKVKMDKNYLLKKCCDQTN
jgi:hypothetical protein